MPAVEPRDPDRLRGGRSCRKADARRRAAGGTARTGRAGPSSARRAGCSTALQEAGIERGSVYLTNAVKHFKWRPRGTRQIHQTPRVGEIEACRPWLEAEAEAVEPDAVLAMGATAARSVFGPGVKVTLDRGRALETPLAPVGAVTIHPSAVLRAREQRREAM